MATTKKVPVKKGKAPSKAPVKKAAKPAPAKAVVKKAPAKPVAKKAPAKPAPAKKALAKPVAKKAPAKPAPVKKAAAPAKKAVVPVKKVVAPPKKAAVPVKKTLVPAKAGTQVKNSVPSKTSSAPPMKKTPTPPPAAPKANSSTPPAKAAPKAAPAKEVKTVPMQPVKAKDIKVPAPKPVVIPKITTKTVKKYEPEFVKSVLDKQPEERLGPSLRYSDAELEEFRELIMRKLEAARKELSYLQGLITRKDDMGGDDSDNRYMTMEDGSLSMEREQLGQMASRQITFIDHLEKALMRIENKTYGICRETGKLIDKARLRAVPHATLSIEAKMSKTRG
jgi:RNA polymerase-binding transcription factor DksA